MKVALLTHYLPTQHEDYTELFKLTGLLRDEYCVRHGYQHIVHSGPYRQPDMYYAFQRLILLHDLMEQNVADVFWIANVQGVVTNMTKKIEDIIDDEHDIYLNKDVHGINMGSFIVKNTQFARDFIAFVISMEPQYRGADWKEQKCVMDWWQHERWTWKIHLLPQRACNSYQYARYNPWPPETPGNWRKGDLFLNLPGMSLSQRLEAVREILQSDMIIR